MTERATAVRQGRRAPSALSTGRIDVPNAHSAAASIAALIAEKVTQAEIRGDRIGFVDLGCRTSSGIESYCRLAGSPEAVLQLVAANDAALRTAINRRLDAAGVGVRVARMAQLFGTVSLAPYYAELRYLRFTEELRHSDLEAVASWIDAGCLRDLPEAVQADIREGPVELDVRQRVRAIQQLDRILERESWDAREQLLDWLRDHFGCGRLHGTLAQRARCAADVWDASKHGQHGDWDVYRSFRTGLGHLSETGDPIINPFDPGSALWGEWLFHALGGSDD